MVKKREVAVDEDRQNYIGGSDISAVCGINRWKTPLRLWATKTGMIEPDDLSDNEAVQMGTKLEEFIAKEFEERTGLQVRRESKAYVHPEHEFLLAHVDRIVLKDDSILECKNCGAYRIGEFSDDDLPIEMIYQTMWNTGLAGREKGYLAALVGGNHFIHKEITFDREMFDMMVEKAVGFWGMVKNGEAPVATSDDGDTLFEMHPHGEDQVVEVTDEVSDEIARMLEETEALKRVINDAEKKQDENKNIIKQIIGEADTVLGDGYKCTWKNQSRTYVDSKKLKEDELYEKYSYAKESRVFRYKLIKKEK